MRKCIDWTTTGRNLRLLRKDNINLRRYVCRTLKSGTEECKGDGNCDKCRFDMDSNISQAELAAVFSVSDSVILNWERGISKPQIEDIMLYADICKVDFFDVLIFEE